jgi:hypothetical protein
MPILLVHGVERWAYFVATGISKLGRIFVGEIEQRLRAHLRFTPQGWWNWPLVEYPKVALLHCINGYTHEGFFHNAWLGYAQFYLTENKKVSTKRIISSTFGLNLIKRLGAYLGT